MNFGFSGEMVFIFLLALILFGPKKMPEIGRQVARLLNEFRRASNEFRSQIEAEVSSLDVSGKDGGSHAGQQILPSLQAPLGSLASRIFNPPSAEKPEHAENLVPENTAAVEAELASSPTANVEVQKVAPDA
jgi:TatA/E family protein of Tat protein translocase